MLVKNCRLVLENGNEVLRDILIEGGTISKILEKAESYKGDVIDAEGRYVLPGIIDAHTHMRDPGLSHKEDFERGSMACAKGGVTTFLDMPNTIPNTITAEILDEKINYSKGRSYVDYGFHFGGSKADNSKDISKIRDVVASTKIFLNMSTGDMLIEDEKIMENLFKESKIVSVHAEEDMVEKALELAGKYNKPLYLCHLSKKEEVEMLREAKRKGYKVYGEVTPHHLFLTSEDREKNEKSNALLRMKPELKESEDCEALWAGILDGTIDTIGTDHAPHLLEEKFEKPTYGIPGIENSLELMLSAVKSGRINMAKVIEIMSSNPAAIFRIQNKGKIAEGYDADLVIVDTTKEKIIDGTNIISKCGWTPYEGMKAGGEILTTIVRGNVVYNLGQFFDKIGEEVKFMNRAKAVAKSLLSTGAVRLNVKEPFTFVSGIKSPIYCDNRKMIGFPAERQVVVDAFIEKLSEKDFDIIAGTATAGIPWAAFIAQLMNKPMAYIRSEKKAHGAGRQIEGADFAGKKVVVIEDLISTGGSSIKAVEAAREAGAAEVEILAIFSYEFEKAYKNFAEAEIPWETISNFSALLELATEENYLTADEAETASKWNKAPDQWGR